MKAAVVTELGRLEIKEIEVPRLKAGGLLCRVLACGICGSDLRILEAGNPRVTFPAILGHELACEVVEVGSGVSGFRGGDRIAVGADVPCGACGWCGQGAGNCCEQNLALGYQFPGGFSEYCLLDPVVVAQGPIALIPNGVATEQAALAEPLACCLNGLERAGFAAGKSVLVIGAGPMGILLGELARASGASLAILCDLDPRRLAMAGFARVDHIVDGSNGLVSRIMEVTHGHGVDIVLTACAAPEAQELALELVARRGCVTWFGGLPLAARAIAVNSNAIHYKEISITGAHGSTPRQHARALEWIASGQIDVSLLITHRFPLDQIHEAFEAVRHRLGLKVMVLPHRGS